MPDVDAVWRRIEEHAGERFEQVRGATFTYRVGSGHVVPDRTPRQIPRSHFGRALDLVPLTGPGEIQALQGPSYIYAILMDARIRQGDW